MSTIKLEKKEFVTAWKEKYITLFVDALSWATIRYSNIIGNGMSEYFSFLENGKIIEVFHSKDYQEKMDHVHGQYFLKSEKRRTWIIDKYKEIFREYRQFERKLGRLDLPGITNSEILIFFTDFFDFFVKMLAYYRATRPEVEVGADEIMRKVIRTKFETELLDEMIGLITESPKESIILREKKDWLKILIKKSADKKDLEKHIEKFPSFFINIINKEETVRMLMVRWKSDHRRIKKIKEEITNKINFLKELPKKQKTIYKQCNNNKKLVTYSKMIQDFGWYRLEFKDVWAGAEIKFMPLFQEIAERMVISVSDLVNFYTIEEVKDFLAENKTISKKELKKRKRGLAILVRNGRRQLISGAEALKLLKVVRGSIKKDTIITGTTACRGLVSGRVSIIFPDSMNGAKFKRGDILVTTGTQPAMVPIMSQASAIVTDFGGMTSHSAIVARELKIPCIIGTKIATKVLKDGDMVEVDANKGIVKIIKQ